MFAVTKLWFFVYDGDKIVAIFPKREQANAFGGSANVREKFVTLDPSKDGP